jgi:hypothetical protein
MNVGRPPFQKRVMGQLCETFLESGASTLSSTPKCPEIRERSSQLLVSKSRQLEVSTVWPRLLQLAAYRNAVGFHINSAAKLLSPLVGAGGFEPPTYTVSRRGPSAAYNA